MIQFNPIAHAYVAPIDLETFSKSMDRLETGHKEAMEEYETLKNTFHDLNLNNKEFEPGGFVDQQLQQITSILDENTMYGNAMNAYDKLNKFASDMFDNPAMKGRLESNNAYEEFKKKVNDDKNLPELYKQYFLADDVNPYNYEDNHDENGNITIGKIWKPNEEPVNIVDVTTILNSLVKTLSPRNGNVCFRDKDGRPTMDASKSKDGKLYVVNSTDNKIELLPSDDIKNAFDALLNADPATKASLEQDYKIDRYYYNKDKINNSGDVVVNQTMTTDQGLPLSFETYIQKKVFPYLETAAYLSTTASKPAQRSTTTSSNNKITWLSADQLGINGNSSIETYGNYKIYRKDGNIYVWSPKNNKWCFAARESTNENGQITFTIPQYIKDQLKFGGIVRRKAAMGLSTNIPDDETFVVGSSNSSNSNSVNNNNSDDEDMDFSSLIKEDAYNVVGSESVGISVAKSNAWDMYSSCMNAAGSIIMNAINSLPNQSQDLMEKINPEYNGSYNNIEDMINGEKGYGGDYVRFICDLRTLLCDCREEALQNGYLDKSAYYFNQVNAIDNIWDVYKLYRDSYQSILDIVSGDIDVPSWWSTFTGISDITDMALQMGLLGMPSATGHTRTNYNTLTGIITGTPSTTNTRLPYRYFHVARDRNDHKIEGIEEPYSKLNFIRFAENAKSHSFSNDNSGGKEICYQLANIFDNDNKVELRVSSSFMKELLGRKGLSLNELSRLGLEYTVNEATGNYLINFNSDNQELLPEIAGLLTQIDADRNGINWWQWFRKQTSSRYSNDETFGVKMSKVPRLEDQTDVINGHEGWFFGTGNDKRELITWLGKTYLFYNELANKALSELGEVNLSFIDNRASNCATEGEFMARSQQFREPEKYTDFNSIATKAKEEFETSIQLADFANFSDMEITNSAGQFEKTYRNNYYGNVIKAAVAAGCYTSAFMPVQVIENFNGGLDQGAGYVISILPSKTDAEKYPILKDFIIDDEKDNSFRIKFNGVFSENYNLDMSSNPDIMTSLIYYTAKSLANGPQSSLTIDATKGGIEGQSDASGNNSKSIYRIYNNRFIPNLGTVPSMGDTRFMMKNDGTFDTHLFGLDMNLDEDDARILTSDLLTLQNIRKKAVADNIVPNSFVGYRDDGSLYLDGNYDTSLASDIKQVTDEIINTIVDSYIKRNAKITKNEIDDIVLMINRYIYYKESYKPTDKDRLEYLYHTNRIQTNEENEEDLSSE